jgi:hypothetical protein
VTSFSTSSILSRKEKAEEYQEQQALPHIYFDNFLPPEAAEAALRDFPNPSSSPGASLITPTRRSWPSMWSKSSLQCTGCALLS